MEYNKNSDNRIYIQHSFIFEDMLKRLAVINVTLKTAEFN